MHKDVIEHAAQRIAGLAGFVADGLLDGLGNRDAQTAGRIGRFLKDFSAGVGLIAGAGDTVGPPDLHHQFAEGLLIKTDAHHKDLAFQADQFAGESEGRTPLAGSGLSGQPLDAELFVIPGLRDSRIGLVAAGRAYAFIFIVNLGRSAQEAFEPFGTAERGRTPLI